MMRAAGACFPDSARIVFSGRRFFCLAKLAPRSPRASLGRCLRSRRRASLQRRGPRPIQVSLAPMARPMMRAPRASALTRGTGTAHHFGEPFGGSRQWASRARPCCVASPASVPSFIVDGRLQPRPPAQTAGRLRGDTAHCAGHDHRAEDIVLPAPPFRRPARHARLRLHLTMPRRAARGFE